MVNILWLIALVIGIYGVLRIVKGDLIIGVVLIVVALAVGPGGWSVLS